MPHMSPTPHHRQIFFPFTKYPQHFISLIFGLQAQPAMAAKMYSSKLLMMLGFKVLMVNSGVCKLTGMEAITGPVFS